MNLLLGIVLGGWDYEDGLINDNEFVKKAYKDGVPMGGDLPDIEDKAKAPKFAVWVLKDPKSGNLDRVQIIKGWTQDGKPHEKIYDVAFSGNRIKDARTGKLPDVGSTVDIGNASYTNSIGAAQLSAVWTDPDFDPRARAFYYARIIEIPTPRWPVYDAKYFDFELPSEVPVINRDRAYTSPIWYTP